MNDAIVLLFSGDLVVCALILNVSEGLCLLLTHCYLSWTLEWSNMCHTSVPYNCQYNNEE